MPNKILKRALFLILLGSPLPTLAQTLYATITTQEGEVLEGEVLSDYEKGWFWEKEKPSVSYKALFTFTESHRPIIRFISQARIKDYMQRESEHSLYREYMESANLLLKRAPLKGANYISTAHDGHHLKENMYGDFAWDVTYLHQNKMHAFEGQRLTDYWVWNQPVHSPIQGRVVEMKNNRKDNPADPSLTSSLNPESTGNYILIHVHGPFYFILMHFKKDSIPKRIKVGAPISPGDYLGRVGNSGVSYIPHLHMTLYYWSKNLNRFVSVPSFFDRKGLVPLSPKKPPFKKSFSPKKGDFIQSRACESVLVSPL